MPFDNSFERGVGVPGVKSLGSDVIPSTLTGAPAAAYALLDNAITFQLQEAGPQPLKLAIAVAYSGTGTPGAATVGIYLWDPQQTKTWLVVGSESLNIGEVITADLPVVMSALAAGWTIALVLSAASPATGTYTVAAGLSESDTAVAGANGATGGASAAAVSSELANSYVVRSTPGTVLSLDVEIEQSLADQILYVNLYDADDVVPDGSTGTTPVLGSYVVNHVAGTPDVLPLLSTKGLACTNGCVAQLSSTRPPTQTSIAGGPWAWFNGEVGA
jgi:hypothetical protein